MNHIRKSSTKSISSVLIQIRIPVIGTNIRCNPNGVCCEADTRPFHFNNGWVSVEPSKHVRYPNRSSEFINDDGGLASIPIPKLGTRVLGEGVEGGFIPGSS